MSNSFQAYRYFHPISTQNLRLGSCIILHTTCVCYAIFRIYVLFYSEAVCFLPKMLDSISGLINIEFAFNQEGNYLPFKLVMSIPQVPTHVYVPSFSNPVLSISIHQVSNASMPLNGLPSFSKSSERPETAAMAVPDLSLSSPVIDAPCAGGPSANSSVVTDAGEQQRQQSRKARRCWSPELHRRFVAALQQLGGPHGE
jgi:hypothetical protein